VFDTLRAQRPGELERFFAEKIECITGEITEPDFGLPNAQFRELASRVDIVINAAASVNFREPLDQALAINALSLCHLTELARAARAPLVQVSTCYVNGYNNGEIREQIVHPTGGAIQRHGNGYYDVKPLIQELQQKIALIKQHVQDPKLRERRLTELGIDEANRHGWNDTYTFTKWMGEQLAGHGMIDGSLTILRPSIIESTLQEPAPGWVEGVKVADAVILAYARGKTDFFPAKTDGVIDIIPADLVANSILLSAAEALAQPGRHRIYQCSSGSSNPIRIGEMLHLLQDECKRNWRHYDKLFYGAPAKDFRFVDHRLFRLVLGAMLLGVSLWSAVRRIFGVRGESRAMERMRTTQTLAITFSFYTRPSYRFQNKLLIGLAGRFRAEDRERFPVDAKRIHWQDYLCRIHMAGLNKYAIKRKEVKRVMPASAPTLPVAETVEAAEAAGTVQ